MIASCRVPRPYIALSLSTFCCFSSVPFLLSSVLSLSVLFVLYSTLLVTSVRFSYEMSTRAAFESLGSNQNFERRGLQRWLVEVDTQSARMSFLGIFSGGGGNDAVGTGPLCLLPRLLLTKYQGKHKGVDDIRSLTFFHVFVYGVVLTSLYVLSVF